MHETYQMETTLVVNLPDTADFLGAQDNKCKVAKQQDANKYEKSCQYLYYEGQVNGYKKIKSVFIFDICSGETADLCEYYMPLILEFPIRNSFTNDLKIEGKYIEVKF